MILTAGRGSPGQMITDARLWVTIVHKPSVPHTHLFDSILRLYTFFLQIKIFKSDKSFQNLLVESIFKVLYHNGNRLKPL